MATTFGGGSAVGFDVCHIIVASGRKHFVCEPEATTGYYVVDRRTGLRVRRHEPGTRKNRQNSAAKDPEQNATLRIVPRL